MNYPKILTRYSKPGQYDMLPKGTLCRIAEGESGRVEIYEQVSEDENIPQWELQEGSILERLSLAITACEDVQDPH